MPGVGASKLYLAVATNITKLKSMFKFLPSENQFFMNLASLNLGYLTCQTPSI